MNYPYNPFSPAYLEVAYTKSYIYNSKDILHGVFYTKMSKDGCNLPFSIGFILPHVFGTDHEIDQQLEDEEPSRVNVIRLYGEELVREEQDLNLSSLIVGNTLHAVRNKTVDDFLDFDYEFNDDDRDQFIDMIKTQYRKMVEDQLDAQIEIFNKPEIRKEFNTLYNSYMSETFVEDVKTQVRNGMPI